MPNKFQLEKLTNKAPVAPQTTLVTTTYNETLSTEIMQMA
jgi:hypothetical protein